MMMSRDATDGCLDATRRRPRASARLTMPSDAAVVASRRRYEAARAVSRRGTRIDAELRDETRALLDVLRRQVEHGARANAPRAVLDEDASRESAGWGGAVAMRKMWESLGTMSAAEAMRLYVRTLEEDCDAWWDPERRSRTNAGMREVLGTDDASVDMLRGVRARGRWEFVEHAGKRPTPRFQHGACVAEGKMYVVGGSYRGRFCADTHELDLDTWTWRNLRTPMSATPDRALPACAGHRAIRVGNDVYVVGGRFKGGTSPSSSSISVFKMILRDGLDEVEWIRVETRGEQKPVARRGASVTATGGNRLVVFGGEDEDGRFFNDAWILDMTSLEWEHVHAPGGHPPEPRADHAAAMWGPDALLVFGGTGRSTKCFDTLHVLDLAYHKWTQLTPRDGPSAPPRAGHAGALLRDGRYWALIGGGNNVRGLDVCTVLDLEEMTWVSPDALPSPPVVGEGMTLCALSTPDGSDDVIIAFGGYNGNCQNDTQVLRLAADFPSRGAEADDDDARKVAENDTRSDEEEYGEDDDDSDGDDDDDEREIRGEENDEISAAAVAERVLASIDLDTDPPQAATFFGIGASVDALRNENTDLRVALRRLRSDAKRLARAHLHDERRRSELERDLSRERERASELERKLAILAAQFHASVPGDAALL